MKIPISKPLFGEEERRQLLEPLETGWVVQGPKVAEFERLFAELTGTKHALATTSCTTALQLCLVALGLGEGDEAIVPAFTWVATANVVEMQRARPIFADVSLDTFNIDVTKLDGLVTPKTRAILPVSLFGLSADMDAILSLAKRHRLEVVEDDACALAATYKGKHAGSMADAGCFSFHPRKAITTGEGGMVVTNDDDIAAKVRCLRDHGGSKSDLQRHMGARSYLLPEFDVVGFNYRMTDFQGALGVAQMGRVQHIVSERTRRARIYDEALAKLGWLRPPAVPAGYSHGYQAYVALFCPERPTLANVEQLHARRNTLMDGMEAAGIATRPGTHAVHMLGFYRKTYGIRPEDFPGAYMADRLSLAIPLYAQMTDEEQQYVIDTLRRLGPGS